MGCSPGIAVALGTLALTLSPRPAAADDKPLSLIDAVQTAIASDADLYVAREETRIVNANISLARSAFATRLFGEVSTSRDNQSPSAISFGAIDKITGATFGVAGRIQTGMTFTVSAGLVRRERDAEPFVTIYNPALTTALRAEVVQPLWRGAFADARRPIVVASLRRDRSEHELRARIESTVGIVQVAYWNLVRARAERDARRSALALATEQLEESKRLTRLGTGSNLDIVEAESGVSRRTLELLRTEQDVVEAEGRLFEAIGVRAGDAGWTAGRTIVPTDEAQIEPLAAAVDAQLALARTRRGEVLAAHDLIAAESAELELKDNQRRPALDLVAAAGTVGFAGALATSYATSGVNTGGLDPPYTSDPAYNGGLGTSLRNVGRDASVYVGLRFEMPLGDHEAKVRHSIQQHAVSRARLTEREVASRIESEVRTAVARIAVDVQLVEAADRAVILAEKLLEGTRKRFRAGASTSFDVLRVSEEQTRARIEAARARADYRVSRTRLAAATGTLIDGFGITVKTLGASPK